MSTMNESAFLFQEFFEVLLEKVLLQLLLKDTGINSWKWLSNLATESIHLREGNTFAK